MTKLQAKTDEGNLEFCEECGIVWRTCGGVARCGDNDGGCQSYQESAFCACEE